MQKILINLLPAEVRAEQLKEKKFSKIQGISVFILLILAFLASATVALGVLQSQEVKQVEGDLKQAEDRVSSLNPTESSLVALKDRLSSIEKIQGSASIQRTLYNLINSITPTSTSINNIAIDSSGLVVLSAVVDNAQGLEEFLDNLLSREKNEGKIKKLEIENLTRAKDGSLRLNLTVSTK